MSKSHVGTVEYPLAGTEPLYMALDTLSEDAQVTIKDTGWSEEDQERMRLAGYDGVDMVMAWYS